MVKKIKKTSKWDKMLYSPKVYDYRILWDFLYSIKIPIFVKWQHADTYRCSQGLTDTLLGQGAKNTTDEMY